MCKTRQILYIARGNFRKWHKNPRIILCFLLAFIFCFLLSDRVMQFAQSRGTYLQGVESFLWTFGDAQSVLAISILLLLLFSDMPNLSNEVPYFMVRTDRVVWMLGQILYLISAVFFFMLFILAATVFLSAERAYPANMWSDTAAVLGYRGDAGGAGFCKSDGTDDSVCVLPAYLFFDDWLCGFDGGRHLISQSM